jgi:arylsulfatase A
MAAIGLIGALGVVCLAGAAAPSGTAATRPNIIFILADDYGIPGVGCYGGVYKTPNLDALADGGLRFANCFAAPLCGPSRALCMTGRYAFRTGVVDNGTGARAHPKTEISIARVLRQAGYATAVAGKWRQLSHFQTKADAEAWGFDEFLTWGTADAGKGDRYWNPLYNHNGTLLPDTKGKYGPDLLHDFVVDFARRHRDRPFFIYYPTPLIHGPILRTPDSPADHTQKAQLYADNVAYLDKLVGRLVADLERLELRERTAIVFTGDNGSVGTGTIHGRPVDGNKGDLKEGGSRVPLIVQWPGVVPAGRVCDDLVDFSDFYPTFVELAGAKLPPGVTIDGRSFAPRLLGTPAKPREWVYLQLGQKYYIRDARWKLTGDGAFFDMHEAPDREIAVTGDADPAAAAARTRLQQALANLVPADLDKNPPSDRKLIKRLLKRQQRATKKGKPA